MECDSAVVDLEGALRRDPAERARVAEALGGPCSDWGVFQLVGHGLTKDDLARFEDAMHAFFDLPRDELDAMRRSEDNAWGYHDAELTKNRRDWKEIFDFGFERGDSPSDGRNRWSDGARDLAPVLTAHLERCVPIARALTEAICVSLDLPANALAADFEEHTSFLRLNRYRPCETPARRDSELVPEEGMLGVHHHTDAGALTLLYQDAVSGLQVERDGKLWDVPPMDGALTVNLGDMLQVWSNDRYRSPVHRVVPSRSEERFSAPFFWNPNYATLCRPLPELLHEGPARYRPISWQAFRRARSDGDYADQGEEVQIAQFRIGNPSG